tara:strand:- start:449 stop:1168 length:720 start_codon:yes stop_codon:yes gene_type:complete
MIDKLVVIPTFNEAENIKDLLLEIHKLNVHVLIVDDNSPDNTSGIIKSHEGFNERVYLLSRKKKLGLGSAYREGFAWGIKNNYRYLIEMDADFSHSVSDLEHMINKVQNYDLIIGSRYIPGGKIVGWSKKRYILSYLANKYSKLFTLSPINDMTSGFRIYTTTALNKIKYYETKSNGYSFQIEMTVLSLINKLSILEIPITFSERREGNSKMNKGVVFEAFPKVLMLSFKRIKSFLTTT